MPDQADALPYRKNVNTKHRPYTPPKYVWGGCFWLETTIIINIEVGFIYILVQSHFELVSSLQALEATEPVSQPVTQMAVDLINIHLISVQ